ncbi:MAG: hypothetical protein DI623_07920 [Sphingomonas sanxanigenens]|uniref:Argininosuccinate lyase n=1 Tax=Sphingomonas sanxanigenens TaxID=397260 RepID=A0A2W5C452_9SPHN|nr:MAG: hypothetical protein DI623_07920 [Sphingomonas sanxanigenens]
MNRAVTLALALALAVALGGCGGRQTLKPTEGKAMPPKPAFATTALTPDQMMAADSQARPRRSDELLRRSQERGDDRFDQPPRN